jgi:ComEC/Rec2-related protein
VWLAVAGLCAGVLAGGGTRAALVLLSGGAAMLTVRRRPVVLLTGVVAVTCGAGMAASSAREDSPLVAIARRVPRCELEGRVLEQMGGLGTLVAVLSLRCGTIAIEDAGVLVVDLEGADAGALVRAEGWLMGLTEDPFDVARRRGGAEAAFHASDLEVGPVTGGLQRVAAAVRGSLRRATSHLARDRSALVRGLTIGDTSGMDRVDEDALRRAGLSHLVAVSGSNVALVLGVVLVAARVVRPKLRLVLAAAALTVLVVVVGPEPSVLRAAAMGAIALLALGSGIRADPLAALGVAVLGVVGVRPGMVASVGLHLSVAATAGIIVWTAPIAGALRRVPRPLALALGATLAAQFAVAPITAGVFGQLSMAGPVANLVALPAVAPATVAGLAGAVGELMGLPGGPLGAVAGWCAGWILATGRFFGAQGWSAIDVPAWSGGALAAPAIVAGVTALSRRG